MVMVVTVIVLKMMTVVLTYNGLQEGGTNLAEDTNLVPLALAIIIILIIIINIIFIIIITGPTTGL